MPALTTDNYLGAFRFRVFVPNTEDVNQAFVRVSGVVSTSETMEFMHGVDQFVQKGVGRASFEDVTLERIYNGIDDFYRWRIQVENGNIDRRAVTIELWKADGTVARSMVCEDAWPSRWEMPDLDASGSGEALEKITLTVRQVRESG